MKPIHDRMPVILPWNAESIWLDQGVDNAGLLTSLLVPFDAEEMEAYEVPAVVNSPKCVAPAR